MSEINDIDLIEKFSNRLLGMCKEIKSLRQENETLLKEKDEIANTCRAWQSKYEKLKKKVESLNEDTK